MLSSALDAIGGTELIELARIHSSTGRVLAKAEFLQPGGSVKDRSAKAIVLEALKSGALEPGQPVVEMTSGNMGAGLAVVCAVLGHPLIVTMSAGNSPARARMLEGLGAEVILVEQVDGTPGHVTGQDIAAAAARARELGEERTGFFADQFNNPATVSAHQTGTGPELWQQSDQTIDGFVAAVGTGGTFIGVARFLREVPRPIVCAPVEPATAAVLAGGTLSDPRHLLQGAGYGSEPPAWDSTLADLYLRVTDEEATRFRRLLAEREGLYVGFSSAANVCAAIKLLESGAVPTNGVVATILCDSGLKY